MSIREIVERFVDGFNRNDLDAVMAFFAADAVYHPGDGSEHRGTAAIRAAFAPQFRGAFGRMQFDVDDVIVDEGARKAAIRWICRHDLSNANAREMPTLSRLFYRIAFGARTGWYGMDVFHFGGDGRITAKHSYRNARLPQLRRELGR